VPLHILNFAITLTWDHPPHAASQPVIHLAVDPVEHPLVPLSLNPNNNVIYSANDYGRAHYNSFQIKAEPELQIRSLCFDWINILSQLRHGSQEASAPLPARRNPAAELGQTRLGASPRSTCTPSPPASFTTCRFGQGQEVRQQLEHNTQHVAGKLANLT